MRSLAFASLLLWIASSHTFGQFPGADLSHGRSSSTGTVPTTSRSTARPAASGRVIRASNGMQPDERDAAIAAAVEELKKAVSALDDAKAAADREAVRSDTYRDLLATANSAAARAQAAQGTREDRQAAMTAAADAAAACESFRETMAGRNKNVLTGVKDIRLKKIKLWSAFAVDMLDDLRQPDAFIKAGTWTFKGDTLVGANIADYAAISLPTELPSRYLLRVEIGPCDVQFLQIMVPVGMNVATVRFGPASFVERQTIAVFVDATSQDAPVISLNGAEVMWQKFPSIFAKFPKHTGGLGVSSTAAPFNAVIAIPCRDLKEAQEIVAVPVYLGATWQPGPRRFSHQLESNSPYSGGDADDSVSAPRLFQVPKPPPTR
jgi:hypothetical protein